ncbi:MAG: HAE1 family hydrophobic/amphiphilic exporter-1/multidrug efflux pump [Halopseudomonas sp.]|jgi:hydrophobe/amphiphile efflux-1 (HAE1) family protein|uniref:efflux RND transporter permease subunit n=1 Tax=Haliea salexigens TaxID=287487 RepID=UPI00041DE268|nr:efflux RND transporter permease subunit [Haliea salexigens]|tara:strand:+ start:3883 stop:6999 length:3117 start_codon:yes stop_codon:yes gene_type:complete
MSRFFIDRPIFAWVLAIIAMLAGVLAIRALPIAQFPSIAPPAIEIRTLYPGADATTLSDSTTAVIEQQLKGIDNLRYFRSNSDSAGNLSILLTFEQGTDPDTAQVQVQNKVQQAMPLLPQEVQQQGVTVEKSSAAIALILSLYSEDGSHDQVDLGDITASMLQDPIGRITGVGSTQIIGTQYAMRVWVDPIKLGNLNLTFGDIKAAIRDQNAQVSAGEIGSLPTTPGQALNVTVSAQSRLEAPEQFREILLRSEPDGSTVRLRDVAEVEIGGEIYNFDARLNGMPAVGMTVTLASGANALDTIGAVKDEIERLSKQLPADIKLVYPYDITPFVELSVQQVVFTLLEAIVLVFLVMFLFLQNWRATLIPTIAVPVVLLGTFAVLYTLGFSINSLTLFGMVLAIGLLVDDAIVVVENVERLIQEKGLTPLEAARRSMDELGGALVGIGVVISAVFLPMAFFGGSAGIIYRQFSITIVVAMTLSVLVALILTPSLCASFLKPANGTHQQRKGFFGWFNRSFDRGVKRYGSGVLRVNRNWGRSLLVYALVIGVLGVLFARLPGGFLPDEDQGMMMAQSILPPGSTMEQTVNVMTQLEHQFLVEESANVAYVFSVSGFDGTGQAQNVGAAFLKLRDWSERPGRANSSAAIAERANRVLAQLPGGSAVSFIPPAVLELGNATGFNLQLIDTGGIGHNRLIAARDQLLELAHKDETLSQVRASGVEDVSQLRVKVDQARAGALGLNHGDINDTLSTALGGSYVNDFLDRGRVKKVMLQATAEFRDNPEDIGNLYVRGASGEMAPLSAIADTDWGFGPARLERYNGRPAIEILGAPAPGYSSGAAMARMEALAEDLPEGVGLEWSGASYEERLSSGQAPALYALSVLIIFLALAALYESWSVPMAVILAAPIGAIGALLAAWLTGLNNDIYLQVGLITTVGVASKNAILIVEFAEEKMRSGLDAATAAYEAAKLRLRPILMTSFAFGFGVLPLAISTGAGSGGQNAIGRSVVGGMFTATLLAIFFIPMFYYLVKRLFRQDRAIENT